MIKTGEKIKKKGDRSPDRRGRDKDRMKMLKRGLTSFDPKIVDSMMNSEKGQRENKRSKQRLGTHRSELVGIESVQV